MSSAPDYIRICDQTGDGIPDLLYPESANLRVRPGLDDGLFAIGNFVPIGDGTESLGASRLKWSDINADGLDDLLIVRGQTAILLWLYPNNGDGTYGDGQAFHGDLGATVPMVEDVNGDGLVDLVTVNRSGVRVVLQE